jgi:hypothetical protein
VLVETFGRSRASVTDIVAAKVLFETHRRSAALPD